MRFCLGFHVKKGHVLGFRKQVERGSEKGKVDVGRRETDRERRERLVALYMCTISSLSIPSSVDI